MKMVIEYVLMYTASSTEFYKTADNECTWALAFVGGILFLENDRQ